MTKDECAIISAYTGISMLQGDDLGYLYRYLSKFIGRPAYTHELPDIAEHYKEEIKEDFLTLCRNAVDIQEALKQHIIEPEVSMIKNDSVRNLTDEEIAVFEEWLNHDATIESELLHGRWVPTEYDGYANGVPVWDKWECSNCGHEHNGEEDTLTAFCPDCGASMDVADINVDDKGGVENDT